MGDDERLRLRVAERDSLLERAVRLLKDDDRVVAAWLHGSMGRGMHDGWSDIDLWIVVDDLQMDDVRGGRNAFAAQVGTVLLSIEAPQNAPTGGAYLLAMYPGADGSHIIDFSWQPLSMARRPADTVLLFGRIDVQQAEPSVPESLEDRLAKAAAQIRFFWMMTNVVAKYIARRDTWGALALLHSAWSTVRQIEWLAGKRPTSPALRDRPDFAPPMSSEGQLAALRGLIGEIETVIGGVPELRVAVAPDVPEQTRLYLALVERW